MPQPRRWRDDAGRAHRRARPAAAAAAGGDPAAGARAGRKRRARSSCTTTATRCCCTRSWPRSAGPPSASPADAGEVRAAARGARREAAAAPSSVGRDEPPAADVDPVPLLRRGGRLPPAGLAGAAGRRAAPAALRRRAGLAAGGAAPGDAGRAGHDRASARACSCCRWPRASPCARPRWPAAIWWLYTPGVAAVALGMGLGRPWLLGAGAVAVVLALLGWAALLAAQPARRPRHAGRRGARLGCARRLLVVLARRWRWRRCTWACRCSIARTALALHVAFAAYGFMGLLALGLSYILVPMFALGATPDERLAIASCALAVARAGAGGARPRSASRRCRCAWPRWPWAPARVALHLRLMRPALRTRHAARTRPLVHAGAHRLGAAGRSLVAGAGALSLDAPLARHAARCSALVLIGGWLLSFLLGMLQRILPFLASMHAAARRPARRPRRRR